MWDGVCCINEQLSVDYYLPNDALEAYRQYVRWYGGGHKVFGHLYLRLWIYGPSLEQICPSACHTSATLYFNI